MKTIIPLIEFAYKLQSFSLIGLFFIKYDALRTLQTILVF